MHAQGKKLTQHFPDYGLLYYKSHQKFPLNFRISLSPLREKGLLLFLHFSSIAIAKNQDLSGRGLEATQWLWEFLSRGVTSAMGVLAQHGCSQLCITTALLLVLLVACAQFASSALQGPWPLLQLNLLLSFADVTSPH